jgi:hypothetical protein
VAAQIHAAQSHHASFTLTNTNGPTVNQLTCPFYRAPLSVSHLIYIVFYPDQRLTLNPQTHLMIILINDKLRYTICGEYYITYHNTIKDMEVHYVTQNLKLNNKILIYFSINLY